MQESGPINQYTNMLNGNFIRCCLLQSIHLLLPRLVSPSSVAAAEAAEAEAAEAEAMQGPLLKLRRRYSNLCVSLEGATREERHVTREYFLAGAPSDTESHAESHADGSDGSDGISDGRGAGGGGGDGGGGVGGGSAGSAAIPLLQWQLLDSLGGHTIDLVIDLQEGTDTGYNAGGGGGDGGGDGDEDDDGNGGVVPVLTVGSLTSLLASPALLELFLNSGGVRPCKHGGCEDREAQARSIGA